MTANVRKAKATGARAGKWAALLLALPALALDGSALAQTVAPGTPAIDSDLVRPGAPATQLPAQGYVDPTAQPRYQYAQPEVPPPPATVQTQPGTGIVGCATRAGTSTYQQDDLISAAENVFGGGAHGLATIIQDILHKQGEPNGYIAGREGGGAFAVGLRYGSGMLCGKSTGRMPVYWTGPSIGFDIGGNAAKTFVLVYNLTKADDLFHRYIAGEGQAYLVGGFHVSYLRRGNVVLIPVRMGVGLRLGVNGGYMKITRNLNYLPF